MRFATTLSLLTAGMLYASASNAAPTCSIEIHPRFNLFVISVGGQPFKNKHYVDYDDAALLQRVLVESGHCIPAQTIAKCSPRRDPVGGNTARLANAGGMGTVKKRSAGAAQLASPPTGCTAP